jgi:hypothetical protein
MAFSAYICIKIIGGALIKRAEIIPILPDPDNAGVGNENVQKQVKTLNRSGTL